MGKAEKYIDKTKTFFIGIFTKVKSVLMELFSKVRSKLTQFSDDFVRMKMRRKLMLAYSVGLTTFVLLAMIGLYSRFVFTENLSEISSIAKEMKSYEKFSLSTEKAVTVLNHYVVTGDESVKEDFQEQIDAVQGHLKHIGDSFPDDEGLVVVLKDSINVIDTKAVAIFDVPFQFRLKQATLLMFEVNETAAAIFDALEARAVVDEEHMYGVFAHTKSTLNFVDSTMAIGALLAFLFALVFVFYLDRSVRIPLEHLSKSVKGISSGKWDSVTTEGSAEITHLADEFNSMVERVSASYEFLERKVEQRTSELNKLNQKLEQLAITDELTGLYNHRFFYEKLEEEFLRAKRYKHQVSVLMIDVDLFKKFNDTYGHLAGDEVLEKVSRCLEKGVRDTDTVARYGGEEFAVIIPEVELNGVLALAERLRESVEHEKSKYKGSGPGGAVTISIGAAIYPEDAEDIVALIKQADEALYLSKDNGRNRVEHLEAG